MHLKYLALAGTALTSVSLAGDATWYAESSYTGPPIPDLFEEDVNWDETMLRQGYDFRTYVIYLDDNDSNLQPPLLKPHLTDSNQWPSLLEVAKQNHSPR